METNSPASTNGASMFIYGTTTETLVITMPSHAWLKGYAIVGTHFSPVRLELDTRTLQLTLPSATMAYADFKQECRAQGFFPVTFKAWLKAATHRCRMRHDRLKEATSSTMFGSMIAA